MIVRDVVAASAAGAAWLALAPTRRVTRLVALWQASIVIAGVAWHLARRVRWELDVRRPAHLASVDVGVRLDRGVTLWLGASLLSLALCVYRWRPGGDPRISRYGGALTAGLLAWAAWCLRLA